MFTIPGKTNSTMNNGRPYTLKAIRIQTEIVGAEIGNSTYRAVDQTINIDTPFIPITFMQDQGYSTGVGETEEIPYIVLPYITTVVFRQRFNLDARAIAKELGKKPTEHYLYFALHEQLTYLATHPNQTLLEGDFVGWHNHATQNQDENGTFSGRNVTIYEDQANIGFVRNSFFDYVHKIADYTPLETYIQSANIVLSPSIDNEINRIFNGAVSQNQCTFLLIAVRN